MKTSLVTSAILFALGLLACSSGSSDNSYWPGSGDERWITQGWTVTEDGLSAAWGQSGRLRSLGYFEEEHGDWRVIEVARVYQQRSEVMGTAFLRMDDDTIEILGYCPGEFSGSAAAILMPSSGPLTVPIGPAAVGQTQLASFDVALAFESVHVDLEVTVEERGLAMETIAGAHDDVLVLSIQIHSEEEDGYEPVDQTIRLWLARGYGPVRAEKELEGVLTGGDFLKG